MIKSSKYEGELTTGMRVLYANGVIGIIFKDVGTIANNTGGWCSLQSVLNEEQVDFKIVRVYSGRQTYGILNFQNLGKLLWEYEEKTQAQIEYEILQVKIKELQEQANKLADKIK